MAGTEPPRYVELTGDLPPGVQSICAQFLGLYKRQQNDVNGKASYGKVGDADSSLWISPGSVGYIAGSMRDIGTSKGHLTRYGSDLSGNSVWRATRASDWVDAPNLRAIALTAADDDEVTVVATSTPAARNAEKRKHALDLELFEPKRARTPSLELETSVAKRRSTLTPDVDKKVLELVQPAIQEWVENKIDEAEPGAQGGGAHGGRGRGRGSARSTPRTQSTRRRWRRAWRTRRRARSCAPPRTRRRRSCGSCCRRRRGPPASSRARRECETRRERRDHV